MAGLVVTEGASVVLEVFTRRNLVDRDANLEIGLHTLATFDDTTTLGDIVEPTGGGYARQDLIDANWSVSGRGSSYSPEVVFAAIGGDMVGQVRGYFIATKSGGGTPRLYALDSDPGAPYTIEEGASFIVEPEVEIP